MSRVILLIGSLLFSAEVFCQENKLPEIIKDIAEELAASDADQEASAAYLDRLYDLAENPVKLNSGSEQELARLFFLSDFQVKALSDYRQTTGRIVSFNELALIPGFDRSTADMIIPFCTLEGKETTIDDSVRLKQFLLTNLTVKRGKDDTTSLGSPWRILTKYKFTTGNFGGGFTTEKDPGEKFFCPGTYKPDFFSANIYYSGKGLVRRVIVGDYSAKFGQGTNINSGISTGLSLTSQAFMSATNEIKPYTSTDENNFFRGAAASFSFKNLELSLLSSINGLDATLGSTTGSSADFIESLYRSGTHNTSSLLRKKDAVKESVTALNFACNFKNLRMGAVCSANSFSLPLRTDSINPGKIFSFAGRNNTTCSFYYNALLKKILLYGEISANDPERYAFVQGLSARPSDRLIINLLFWKNNFGYTTFHGKVPGGSSGNYPQQSMMGSFTFEAARHLFLSGGFYVQHYLWLKYRCSSPSTGVRREIRIKYLPSDKLTLDALYSYRLSMADNSVSAGIADLKQIISRSMKMVVRYGISEYITTSTRIGFNTIEPSGSKGILLMEDLSCRLRQVPISLWLRYAIFKTDDYESRIYTWENDLLYTFSIPALYGTGSRFYIMAAWKISRKAEIRFKYGVLTDNDLAGNFTDVDEFRLQFRLII
jgi:hypothetical protein